MTYIGFPLKGVCGDFSFTRQTDPKKGSRSKISKSFLVNLLKVIAFYTKVANTVMVCGISYICIYGCGDEQIKFISFIFFRKNLL